MTIRSFGAILATLCLVGVLLSAGTVALAAQGASPQHQSPAQTKQAAELEKRFGPVLTLVKQGITQLKQQQYDKALATLSTALGMVKGTDEDANAMRVMLYGLRVGVLAHLHRDRQAVADLRSLLTLSTGKDDLPPEILADAKNKLAWLLATSPDISVLDGKAAVRYAQQSLASVNTAPAKIKQTAMYKQLSAAIIDTLAAAEARAGDYAQAVTQQQQAIALVKDAKEKQDMQQRLHLYQTRKPYTEHYKAS